MKTVTEYKISNKWIWICSMIQLSILPKLLEIIEISNLEIIDWIMFAFVFLILPVTALLYRSKVVVNNNVFELYRGIIGGIWVIKNKPRKFMNIGYPEDDDKGYLSFVLENGKEIYFDPEKSIKDIFIRKNR